MPRDGNHCNQKLTPEQLNGLKAIITCSFLSSIAVLTFSGIYVRTALRRYRQRGAGSYMFREINLYFFSLLFSDLLVALGGILNILWVLKGRSYCGTYCTVQGFLLHIGLPGGGVSTMVISFHTFSTVFLQWPSQSTRIAGLCVLMIMWIFLILYSLLPALVLPNNFYEPTPAWCYVSIEHIALRASGYVCAWLAGATSIVLYGILWLKLRRPCSSLVIESRYSSSVMSEGLNENSSQWKDAWKLLWYPASYCVIIIPLSASRWTSFISDRNHEHHATPFSVTAFSVALFDLSGLIDVILFISTRPGLLFFEPGDPFPSISRLRRLSQNVTNELINIPWLTRSGSVDTSIDSGENVTHSVLQSVDYDLDPDNAAIPELQSPYKNNNGNNLQDSILSLTHSAAPTSSRNSTFTSIPGRSSSYTSGCPALSVNIPTSRISGISMWVNMAREEQSTPESMEDPVQDSAPVMLINDAHGNSVRYSNSGREGQEEASDRKGMRFNGKEPYSSVSREERKEDTIPLLNQESCTSMTLQRTTFDPPSPVSITSFVPKKPITSHNGSSHQLSTAELSLSVSPTVTSRRSSGSIYRDSHSYQSPGTPLAAIPEHNVLHASSGAEPTSTRSLEIRSRIVFMDYQQTRRRASDSQVPTSKIRNQRGSYSSFLDMD